MNDIPDRIFVSIGVSSPEELENLPGVINAAERMAAWGERNGYLPVLICDAMRIPTGGFKHEPVTVERIRTEMCRAMKSVTSEKELKRLIVFFGGHGSALSLKDQFWLLSEWFTDSTEAVHVPHFQSALRLYGPKQVTIIADACQEFSDRFFSKVIGSAVLRRPKPEEAERQYEMDRFLAADSGMQSFMVKGRASREPYCVFSEVLLAALDGDAPEAFETIEAEPCVTSQKLYTYLNEAVPVEAGKLNLKMTPKVEPGFATDRVYFREPGAGDLDKGPRRHSGNRIALDPSSAPREDASRIDAAKAKRARRSDEIVTEAQAAVVPDRFESHCGIAVEGVGVKQVQCSSGHSEPSPRMPDQWFRVWLPGGRPGRDWSDVVVDLEDGRATYVCAIFEFIAALQFYSYSENSLIHRPIGEPAYHSGRVLELLAKANSGLLDEQELLESAAELRVDKHRILTIGCVVAQFYNSIGDIESVRRVAAYYAMKGQIVPFDVAILCGVPIYEQNGSLCLNVPATSRREPRTPLESRFSFTYNSTPECRSSAIGGRAPWLRYAWGAIEIARCDESAQQWREAALKVIRHLAPGPFTTVHPEGRNALLELVGIEQPEPAPEHEYAYA